MCNTFLFDTKCITFDCAEQVLELASPLVFKVDDVVDKDWVKTVQVSGLIILLMLLELFSNTFSLCYWLSC